MNASISPYYSSMCAPQCKDVYGCGCVCECVNLALYKDMCMAFLSCLFIVFCLLTTIVTVPVSLCICACMHVCVCVWECVCLCCIYSCFLISFTVGCSYVLRPVEVFCGFAMYKCTFVSAHVSVCVCVCAHYYKAVSLRTYVYMHEYVRT